MILQLYVHFRNVTKHYGNTYLQINSKYTFHRLSFDNRRLNQLWFTWKNGVHICSVFVHHCTDCRCVPDILRNLSRKFKLLPNIKKNCTTKFDEFEAIQQNLHSLNDGAGLEEELSTHTQNYQVPYNKVKKKIL